MTAALLGYASTFRDTDQADVRARLKAALGTLDRGKWMSLPEFVVRKLLSLVDSARLLTLRFILTERVARVALFLLPVGSGVQQWSERGIYYGIQGFALMSVLWILALRRKSVFDFNEKSYATIICTVLITAGCMINFFFWLDLSLRLPLHWSFAMMLGLLPVYWIVVMGFVGVIFQRWIERLSGPDFFLAMFAATASFVVTFGAMTVGHWLEPTASVPQTRRMLFANLAFDGLTVWVTLRLLRWALKRSSFWRLPVALVADLISSAAFACFVLVLGISAPYQLTLWQVGHVLVGKSPTSNAVELGPLFWVMHTTFLPTLIYVLLTACAWVVKAVLTPIRHFCSVGAIHKDPLKLAAAAFALLATIAGCFAQLMG